MLTEKFIIIVSYLYFFTDINLNKPWILISDVFVFKNDLFVTLYFFKQ